MGLVLVAGAGLLLTLSALDSRAEGPPSGGLDVLAPEGSEILVQQANELLGLRASTVLSLDIDRTLGVPLTVVVPVDGEFYTLDLHPRSLRAPEYRLIVQHADGSYEDVEPGPERTLRGYVAEVEGSGVAASLEEDGLYARFVLSEDEEYWIEPLESRLEGAAPGQYVVYHTADIIPSGGSCGADALTHPLPPEGGERGGSRDACGGGFPCLAELACDADYPYFLNYGSVSAVENRINLVINQVNIQYERDVEIIHEITAIIVRASSAADPYTTNDPEGLLNQFRDHWEANHGNIQRDLAQLFTGRNLSGTTIGIAWLDAVCTDWAYSVVESDCCGTLACAADLSAHEMGHNWGVDDELYYDQLLAPVHFRFDLPDRQLPRQHPVLPGGGR
jgi:hypothetical protein